MVNKTQVFAAMPGHDDGLGLKASSAAGPRSGRSVGENSAPHIAATKANPTLTPFFDGDAICCSPVLASSLPGKTVWLSPANSAFEPSWQLFVI